MAMLRTVSVDSYVAHDAEPSRAAKLRTSLANMGSSARRAAGNMAESNAEVYRDLGNEPQIDHLGAVVKKHALRRLFESKAKVKVGTLTHLVLPPPRPSESPAPAPSTYVSMDDGPAAPVKPDSYFTTAAAAVRRLTARSATALTAQAAQDGSARLGAAPYVDAAQGDADRGRESAVDECRVSAAAALAGAPHGGGLWALRARRVVVTKRHAAAALERDSARDVALERRAQLAEATERCFRLQGTERFLAALRDEAARLDKEAAMPP
ncbi:hypothetical protein M885DRAFT_512403 [Pelagophyceae sp. CCMP2097]|nr:hypothetical protein M885DRAFT_512403 [Pelagophyceae sp. CCMP2097]